MGIKIKIGISFIQPFLSLYCNRMHTKRERKRVFGGRTQNSHPQQVFKFKAYMLELQGEKHLHFPLQVTTLGKV